MPEGVALLLLLGWLVAVWKFFRLRQVCPVPGKRRSAEPAKWPRVSVIMAARNEAGKLEPALKSWLRVGYPNLEFIWVDDRSTDSTGEVMERLALTDPRVVVIRNTELPSGWLGKNHALSLAADRATGEWLLFTDADIHCHPDLLNQILADAIQHREDFVCAFPAFVARHPLTISFNLAFAAALVLSQQMDRVHIPRSRAFAGIGAFNLIKQSLYQKIGTHWAFPMDVADDMVLGKLAKLAGGHCRIYNAHQHLEVEWQADHPLSAMKGIEKNAFTGFGYSWLRMFAGVSAWLFFTCGPFLLLWINPLLAAPGIFLILTTFFIYNPSFQNKSGWWGLLLPIGALLVSVAIIRSAWITTRQQGVRWRDSFYSLRDLKSSNQF